MHQEFRKKVFGSLPVLFE